MFEEEDIIKQVIFDPFWFTILCFFFYVSQFS